MLDTNNGNGLGNEGNAAILLPARPFTTRATRENQSYDSSTTTGTENPKLRVEQRREIYIIHLQLVANGSTRPMNRPRYHSETTCLTSIMHVLAKPEDINISNTCR
jgi:hypothetical protein